MFENNANLDLAKAREILHRPTPKDRIETREGMNKSILSYVSGQYVNQTVIEATDNTFTFEIINSQIVQAEPKPRKWKNPASSRWEVQLDANGKPITEAQAPYVVVQGRMTIPGLGSREQFGVAELLGGTTEQAQSFKGASTDCFKKCASEFGVGLDLYEDKLPPPANNRNTAPEVQKKLEFRPEDVKRIKELKAKAGIEDNEMLTPYIIDFTGDPNASFRKVTPSNIGAFNKFLESALDKVTA